MKRKVKITLTLLSMILLFSCDYETYVINTVHKDGSVTRKVIMKNSEEKFEPEKYRVPVDSTWQSQIDLDLNEAGDTSWILTAEKQFASVEEINNEYRNDKGSNREMQRSADFKKSFKWFTTVFKYTETIEKILTVSCPISDFLTAEELKYYYLPDKAKENLKNGPDSIRIKKMTDSISLKSEQWLWTCEIRQWIEIFYDLFMDHPELKMSREEMRSKESQIVQLLIKYSNTESDGEEAEENDDLKLIFVPVLGEEFVSAFKTEIDSSITVLEEMDKAFWSAGKYDMEIRMPGKIIASNGYAKTDTDTVTGGGILWTVDGDYFLTQQYEMWAESQVSNYWAWIISAFFILFVVTGFVIRSKKEKD